MLSRLGMFCYNRNVMTSLSTLLWRHYARCYDVLVISLYIYCHEYLPNYYKIQLSIDEFQQDLDIVLLLSEVGKAKSFRQHCYHVYFLLFNRILFICFLF